MLSPAVPFPELSVLVATVVVWTSRTVQGNNPPFFTMTQQEWIWTLPEDTPRGTAIAQLTAVDPEGKPVLYGVEGEIGQRYFLVDPVTGIVELYREFDREVDDEYTVKFSVIDDAPANKVEHEATIYITDVNDNPPTFEGTPYETKIPEDLPVGSTVFTVEARDPDKGAGGTNTFFFDPPSPKFRISSVDGHVILVRPLDYEEKNVYKLKVVAKDGGNPWLSTSTNLVIQVKDVQDSDPVFLGLPYDASVREDTEVGHVIVRISAMDQDSGIPNDIQYSIVTGNVDGVFDLDDLTGELRVAKVIDREAEGFNQGPLTITVQALEIPTGDSPGGAFIRTTFDIAIIDVNDETPTFDQSEYSITVSESTLVGAALPLTLQVNDPDEEENGAYLLHLVGRTAPQFLVSPSSAMGEAAITLRVNKPLDYEVEQTHLLEIFANETNGDKYGHATITITLINENDHRPTFTQPTYSLTVEENIPIGTSLLNISASDRDIGEFGDVTYFINDDDPRFRIDSATGVIYTQEQLDYEDTWRFSLTIMAQDGGTPPQQSAARVRIDIRDLNDNRPIFQRDEYVGTVQENDESRTPILRVRATDEDSPPYNILVYNITSGDPLHNFTITTEDGYGYIYTSAPLDYETMTGNLFELTVTASDGGNHTLNSTTEVVIEVEDQNDNGPVFNQQEYNVSVREDISAGDTVLRVFASDADMSAELGQDSVIYSMSGSSRFRINPRDGEITTTTFLDHERETDYVLEIKAVDGGQGQYQRTATVFVNITVLDVNDNSPVFVQPEYYTNIPENITDTEVVVQVNATDEDSTTNGDILYAITGGNNDNAFTINPQSGVILRGTTPLDRETLDGYVLTVDAYNGRKPEMRSTVRVNVRILDVNDRSPVFTQTQYGRLGLRESAGVGTSAVLVRAHDPDLDLGGQVDYGFVSGDNGKFAIDENGLITTSAELDFESKRNYTISVYASDKSPPYKTGYATVVIVLANENDEPPEFNSEHYDAAVLENVDVGTSILQVFATSPDNLAAIEYLFDPNTNEEVLRRFSINGSTGLISTIDKIDREEAAQYDITVISSDGGIETDSATVSIVILDENDNFPKFDLFTQTDVSVTEGPLTPNGSAIARVIARDPDDENNGRVEYTIETGNDLGYFRIEKTESGDGIIRNLHLLDREEQEEYRLRVVACDQGIPQLCNNVTVVVTLEDVNDNVPAFIFNSSYSYNVSVQENVGGGTTVTQVQAMDIDAGDNAFLSYYIISGNEDSMFRMDRLSGDITTRPNSPDRETKDFYNMTVLVEDEGSPQLQAYTTVFIYILDENDNAPVFEFPTYSYTLREGKGSAGIYIVDINATDIDQGLNGRVVFNITDGNDGNEFEIEPDTGKIRTLNELDYENSAGEYQLAVTATDQALDVNKRQTSTTTVTIFVNDINDVVPHFLSEYVGPIRMAEGLLGSFVGSFPALDEDSGDFGKIDYTIDDGDENDEFYISLLDGDLKVKQGLELDRERTAFYNITIRAQDRGRPPLKGFMTVSIEVLDINDNDPMFQDLPYYCRVSENSPVDTLVFKVSANDTDEENNAFITYSITGGNIGQVFRINGTNGEIYVNGLLDREVIPQYTLTVTASDNPQNPTHVRRDTTQVYITVIDENDQRPRFTQPLYRGRISENSQAGTAVDMSEDILAVDADATTNAEVHYSIFGKDARFFRIDSVKGELFVRDGSLLDRETVGNDLSFTVMAADPGGLNESAGIYLEILDQNDNSPIFTSTLFRANVSEGAFPGTSVTRIQASDQDDGLNKLITYRIESGGQDKFTINPETGVIRIAHRQALDREARDQYVLVVKATDHGIPTRSGTSTVLIDVEDINDSAPYFLQYIHTATVSESMGIGSWIINITAVDRDLDSLLDYSITAVVATDLQGNHIVNGMGYLDWFGVDQFGGGLFVNSTLNREKAEVVQLTIGVKDLASDVPQRTQSGRDAQVTISIIDENDNTPTFQPPGVAFYQERILEEVPVGTVVMSIIATDADKGKNGIITYRIVNGSLATEFFAIRDKYLGTITVSRPVDHEQHQWVNFTVQAADEGKPVRTADIPVSIEIVDINDNNPIFSLKKYQASVLENQPAGTEVLRVTATDRDSGSYGRVQYHLSGAGGRFTIHPDQGNITLTEPLDREEQTDYLLSVTATDNTHGLPSNSRENSVQVAVTVLDENDNTPESSTSKFDFRVPENQPAVEYVGTILAGDRDEGDNGRLQFSIIKQEPNHVVLFEVENSTGVISSARLLDRETMGYNGIVELTIQISDLGTPPKMTRTKAVIKILDSNDNSPYFQQSSYSLAVAEDEYGGTSILGLVALDNDEGNVLTYSITDGNEDRDFAIGASTGHVIVAKSLDHETKPAYTLTVTAYDQDRRNGSTTLLVEILDVNDNPPVFSQDVYRVKVTEDVLPGAVVGQVEAKDADSLPQNKKVLYHIISGNVDDTFRIDTDSGEVFTQAAVDRESLSLYQLTIQATNPSGDSQNINGTSQVITKMFITIADVNDIAPMFDEREYARPILENEPVGTSILYVHAEDGDLGNNSRLSYSIAEGNIDNAFRIDEESGLVMVSTILSEKARMINEYRLEVVATDHGTPPLEGRTLVLLTVVDVNDKKPRFIRPKRNMTVSIPENSPSGHFVYQAFAVDEDTGINGIVSYDFFIPNGRERGGDWEKFAIDPFTGNITTVEPLDREHQAEYTLIIVARDQGLPEPFEATRPFRVEVEDVNDNEPEFPRDVSGLVYMQTLAVPEHAEVGTEVGKVTEAIDKDEGENAIVFYYITGGNEGKFFLLDKETGILSVHRDLDRETKPVHTLLIKASSDPDYQVPRQRRRVIDVSDSSLQQLVIEVEDINDQPPRFTRKQYTAGVTVDAKYGSELIQIEAIDADIGNNSVVYYYIESTTYIERGKQPKPMKKTFQLGVLSGVLTTNELFVDYTKGYFELIVRAEDDAKHTDKSKIGVYVLRDEHRVKVVINDIPDYVRTFREEFIAFASNITGAVVNMDDIQYHVDEGEIDFTKTDMLIHVVNTKTNKIMDVDNVITTIDENYDSLERLFKDFNVIEVLPFVPPRTDKDNIDIVRILLILIGVVIFFGAWIFICLMLRYKRLYKRNVRAAIAGSIGSGVGMEMFDVPNTNKYSFEGANPIWLDPYYSQFAEFHEPTEIPVVLEDGFTIEGDEYETQEVSMEIHGDQEDESPKKGSHSSDAILKSVLNDQWPNNNSSQGDRAPRPPPRSVGVHSENNNNSNKRNAANSSGEESLKRGLTRTTSSTVIVNPAVQDCQDVISSGEESDAENSRSGSSGSNSQSGMIKEKEVHLWKT
ncbi:CDH23 [Branchiostoma lanceolatum]|uniref:CDH23 protein n=1 Tax=Branchiostoma lanceolatum TaxID=7740 RepID=A0A8J9Z4L1_BRALA|nr:CDH23 [Branchiostoma lanceolatum]